MNILEGVFVPEMGLVIVQCVVDLILVTCLTIMGLFAFLLFRVQRSCGDVSTKPGHQAEGFTA